MVSEEKEVIYMLASKCVSVCIQTFSDDDLVSLAVFLLYDDDSL